MRVARAVADNDCGLARIKNISDDGAQLRLKLPVMLGDALTLDLAEDLSLTGRVVWTSDSDCGLKFDQSVDCARLLTNLAEGTRAGTTRPLRLSVTKSAISCGENGIRLIGVTDVSQRGMKVRHDGSFTPGLSVKITLPSGIERCGVVRWTKDNYAGVMLLDPFSPEELGSARNL
jgi:hypothetical protein